jgi:hypothetical protein
VGYSTGKAKLVSPDALSEGERAVFDRYAKEFSDGGVCVNVMVGEKPWDLRPLVLEHAKVRLYRFSPPLEPNVLSSVLSECEGFAVIPQWKTEVRLVQSLGQILITRPYVQATLSEAIRSGDLDDSTLRKRVANGIIEQVGALIRRNLVHGHLSLRNISYVDSRVLFLDPRLGVLGGTRDEFLAPEVTAGSEPPPSADLFSLGKVLGTLLAGSITQEQQAVIDQLMLSSPKQRPIFSEVEGAFRFENGGTPAPVAQVAASGKGRLISSATVRSPHAADAPIQESKSTGGRKPSGGDLAPNASRFVWPAVVGLLAVIFVLVLLHKRFPSTYFELAHYVPLLSADRNSLYEADWGSGDKGKMTAVARAAVLDHDLAAENAILSFFENGGKAQIPQLELIRKGFDPLWVEELSRADERALFVLGLSTLVPEGLSDLSPLNSLHPAVLFTVASWLGEQQPSKSNAYLRNQLKGVKLSTLSTLPSPVGELFGTFSTSGVSTLDEPAALGLAAIAGGSASLIAVEAYMGDKNDLQDSLARIGLILPIVKVNELLATQLLATIKDRGGVLGDALGWFDIEQIARWNGVGSSEKAFILLGDVPESGLDLARYSDLLTFPLPAVRKGAAKILAEQFFKPEFGNMLAFLSGDQSRLSREQVVALLATLHLKSDATSSFVSTWFSNMSPDPQTVLLLLLSRGNFDSEDVFNFEAARFLRKTEWQCPVDLLRLLAAHPEPLARSLAYSRLDPKDPAQLSILQQRSSVEKDNGLKESIQTRLNLKEVRGPKPSGTSATATVVGSPKPSVPPTAASQADVAATAIAVLSPSKPQ